MRRYILLLAALLLVPGIIWATAAIQTDSYRAIYKGTNVLIAQAMLCDNSDALTPADPNNALDDAEVSGVTCEAGDWSQAIDCRGMSDATFSYFEYNADPNAPGTGEAKFWNCQSIPWNSRSGNAVDLEAPSTAPASADPKPLCTDLTAGAGVTMIGTTAGVQTLSLSDLVLGYVIAEVEACTNDCDGVLLVSCSR